MNKRERERITAMYSRCIEVVGLSYSQTETIRKASMALSRWCERECNGEVERDERTNLVYHFYDVHTITGWKRESYRVPDRETGAKRRIDAILDSAAPDWAWYYQTDPHGCAVYLYRKADLAEGQDINSVYSSIGIAIY